MIEEKIDIFIKLKVCEKEVITTYGQVSDSSFQLLLFKKKYIEELNPIVEEIKAKTRAEQIKLDNSENYNYEASICRDKG